MQSFLHRYRSVFQMADADGGAAADTAAADAADADTGAAADTATADAANAGDQAAADNAAAGDQQHGNKGRDPWFKIRLNEQEQVIAQERAAREAAEREAANTRQMLERLQRGDKAPPTSQATLPQDEVNRQAEIIANQRMFQNNVNDIIRAGYSAFGAKAFDDASTQLAQLGCATSDFINDVLAVDRGNAHKILNDLAADPDTAMQLARLDSRSRIAELTRRTVMAATKSTETKPPAAKGISKAPPPPPAINAGSRQVKDWRSDDATDDEFTAGFFDTMKKRAESGRR